MCRHACTCVTLYTVTLMCVSACMYMCVSACMYMCVLYTVTLMCAETCNAVHFTLYPWLIMPLFAPYYYSIVVQSGTRTRWVRSTGLKGFQFNAARFVCGEYWHGSERSIMALLQQLQWHSLADCRLIARITLFYNVHI